MAQQPTSVLITGGSSGIGAALARHYAGPGMTLALTGRDGTRPEGAAAQCRAAGAEVLTGLVDATDAAAMAAFIEAADRKAPLDLLIANAGVSGGTGSGDETAEQMRRITAINVDGVLRTVEPAAALMKARGRGQIGLMASLASFRGFPGAPAYCASKAWVRVWGEGLRGHLHGAGVGVTVICPGFVTSPMTQGNPYSMPFIWSAEKAARTIARGLARNKARIAFPWPLYWLLLYLAWLPPWLTDRLFRRMPRKI